MRLPGCWNAEDELDAGAGPRYPWRKFLAELELKMLRRLAEPQIRKVGELFALYR